MSSDVTSGSANVQPKIASKDPRTCATPSMASARDGAEEQALHGFDVSAVREEQDHVIVRRDGGVVMGHDHIVSAHDGSNGSPFGQLDLPDTLANHAGTTVTAVDDDFERLRGTPAQ